MMDAEQQNTKEGISALQEGINQLRIATKRYARKQKKWISNRFLGRNDRQVGLTKKLK